MLIPSTSFSFQQLLLAKGSRWDEQGTVRVILCGLQLQDKHRTIPFSLWQIFESSFCRCFIAHSRGGGSRRRRRPRAPSAVRSPAASASRVPTPTVPLNRGPAAPPCCCQLAPRTIAALAPLLPVRQHAFLAGKGIAATWPSHPLISVSLSLRTTSHQKDPLSLSLRTKD